MHFKDKTTTTEETEMNVLNGSIQSVNLDSDNEPLLGQQQNQHETDSIQRTKRTKYSKVQRRFVYFVDVFFSAFVSSPLSGFFWYTIWKFTEDYVFIISQNMSYFICYEIGFIVLGLAFILQDKLQKLYDYVGRLKYMSKPLCFMLQHTYMYFMCVAVTIEWQGLWDLIESNIDDLQTKLSMSVIAITYACLTRSTRALVSTPYMLIRDRDEDVFEYDLKSNSFIGHSVCANFILSEIVDCLVMVVGWIGFDNFFDYYFDSYLSPEISYYSLLLTGMSSHIVYLIIAFTQFPIWRFISNYTLIIRIVVEHFINTVMFISSILLWKFYWDLGDFFLQDLTSATKITIYFAGNFSIFLIAIVLKLTWVLVGPGVITFDGETEDKIGYFDIEYLSLFLKDNETANSNVVFQDEIQVISI